MPVPTTDIFKKHFTNKFAGYATGIFHPNTELFFKELNENCLKEDEDKKLCSTCKGYGVYNGCIECDRISDGFFGHD